MLQIESAVPELSEPTVDALGRITSPYFLRAFGEGDTLQLPWGRLANGVPEHEVRVRGMRGVEEEALERNDVDAVLAGCLISIGTAEPSAKVVKQLTVSDRTFLLFALRRLSFEDGDIYRYNVECANPHCDKRKLVLSVKLDDIVIRPPDHPLLRSHTTTLRSGKKVVWRILIGEDEPRLRALASKSKTLAPLFASIETVDGKKLAHVDELRGWSTADLNGLRTSQMLTQGGLDTREPLINNCPMCGTVNRHSLELDASFFFPALAGRA